MQPGASHPRENIENVARRIENAVAERPVQLSRFVPTQKTSQRNMGAAAAAASKLSTQRTATAAAAALLSAPERRTAAALSALERSTLGPVSFRPSRNKPTAGPPPTLPPRNIEGYVLLNFREGSEGIYNTLQKTSGNKRFSLDAEENFTITTGQIGAGAGPWEIENQRYTVSGFKLISGKISIIATKNGTRYNLFNYKDRREIPKLQDEISRITNPVCAKFDTIEIIPQERPEQTGPSANASRTEQGQGTPPRPQTRTQPGANNERAKASASRTRQEAPSRHPNRHQAETNNRRPTGSASITKKAASLRPPTGPLADMHAELRKKKPEVEASSTGNGTAQSANEGRHPTESQQETNNGRQTENASRTSQRPQRNASESGNEGTRGQTIPLPRVHAGLLAAVKQGTTLQHVKSENSPVQVLTKQSLVEIRNKIVQQIENMERNVGQKMKGLDSNNFNDDEEETEQMKAHVRRKWETIKPQFSEIVEELRRLNFNNARNDSSIRRIINEFKTSTGINLTPKSQKPSKPAIVQGIKWKSRNANRRAISGNSNVNDPAENFVTSLISNYERLRNEEKQKRVREQEERSRQDDCPKVKSYTKEELIQKLTGTRCLEGLTKEKLLTFVSQFKKDYEHRLKVGNITKYQTPLWKEINAADFNIEEFKQEIRNLGAAAAAPAAATAANGSPSAAASSSHAPTAPTAPVRKKGFMNVNVPVQNYNNVNQFLRHNSNKLNKMNTYENLKKYAKGNWLKEINSKRAEGTTFENYKQSLIKKKTEEDEDAGW